MRKQATQFKKWTTDLKENFTKEDRFQVNTCKDA